MLACEVILFHNFAITGQTHFYGKYNSQFICFWKCTWMRKCNWAQLGIRFCTETGTVTAKELTGCQQLGMHFEANDNFIFFGNSQGGKIR